MTYVCMQICSKCNDDMEQKQKFKNFSTGSSFYFLRHICLVSKKRGMYTYMAWGISFIDKIKHLEKLL